MHNQPKFIPLRSTEFFADRRSERDPIPGTVARGQLHEDVYLYTGRHGNDLGNDLPFKLDRTALLRGQQRYDIYCAPCHSEVGDGKGMIVQRGFKPPPSLHDARLRNAPLGHFFDVMSHGFGAMPDYAAQITPEDRWKIAAYIRALQLSQNATAADVAAEDRGKLDGPPIKEMNLPATSIQNPEQMPGGPRP